MAQEFLLAAEQVLKENQEPMLVKDIVQKALDNQLLESGGLTPVNTMRARLSEHLRKFGRESKFIRVKTNKFGLRSWLNTKVEIHEYVSKPFEKNIVDEKLICIKQKMVDKYKRFFGFRENYQPYLKELSDYNNLLILNRGEAKSRGDIKQLVSYVILKHYNGRSLSFVRGNYGQKESLLKGVLCLGFGGHVNSSDLNLFGMRDAGITNSAYREIAEEIKGLQIFNLKNLGIINDDSSPLGLNHFAFVFKAQLPKNFNINSLSREMSINKISLLTNAQIWNRFYELEFWSQLIVKKYFKRPKNYNPVFIKTKKMRLDNAPLIIVGEIGSGKSEVARHIQIKYSLPLVSTRKCVELLTGIKNFEADDRSNFQDEANKLISSPDGFYRLAQKISSEVHNYNQQCVIIDGVRNLETYNQLKIFFPKIHILYIDTSRDIAYKMYSRRSGGRKVSIDEFRAVRHHEVEKEISLFKTRADAYLFNGGNLTDLYIAINKWWKERNAK